MKTKILIENSTLVRRGLKNSHMKADSSCSKILSMSHYFRITASTVLFLFILLFACYALAHKEMQKINAFISTQGHISCQTDAQVKNLQDLTLEDASGQIKIAGSINFPGLAYLENQAKFSDTRYVSVDGSNDNPGTQNQPWRSVQYAVDRAAPGAVIRLEPGTYHEQVLITGSGRQNAPITIEGARDSQGNRLSRIDAGERVDPDTWEPAPEVGPNVYKNQSLPFEPQILTVDDQFLAHVHRVHDGSAFPFGSAMEVIAWPEDHRLAERPLLVTRRIGQGFRFWDALGGLYVHHPDQEKGITYLRLTEKAGETDPRKRNDIAVSDGGPAINIDNAAHIVIKGIEVTQGNTGIKIHGQGSRDILIDDCFITHGRARVEITDQASDITVRDSHLTMGFHGTAPGAWSLGNDMDVAAREFLYRFFKYAHGTGAVSDDRSVQVRGASEAITVKNSLLEEGLIGISSSSNRKLTVKNNAIHGFSSSGMVLSAGTLDAKIHDNLIHDCNINIRLHHLNSPGGEGHRAYIFRNRMFQWKEPGGRHFFAHGIPGVEEAHPEPEIFIYHNTMVGGGPSFNLNRRVGATPEIKFVNNIINTSRHPYIAGEELSQNKDALGLFDYNWLGGPFRIRDKPAWFGENNVVERGGSPWSFDDLPDFRLPERHRAIEAGIDISQDFTIDDQTYAPLPGIQKNYFYGKRPDIGAVQHE